MRLWALYELILTTLGIISQKMDGSKPPSIGLKLILMVLVDEGFGDVMEQLKDDSTYFCLIQRHIAPLAAWNKFSINLNPKCHFRIHLHAKINGT